MRHQPLGLLVVALLCGLSSVLAHAYVTARADSGKPLLWKRTNCVAVRINATGSDDVTDNSDLEAIRRAMDSWREATSDCSFIRFEELPVSESAAEHYDLAGGNENTISWVESDWEHDPWVVALTVVAKKTTGEFIDADLILNGEHHTFSTTGAAGTRDIQSTVTHELGHMLGLDHTCLIDNDPPGQDHEGNPIPHCSAAPSSVLQTVMYPKGAPGDTTRRTLQADDVLGICSKYPLAKDPGVCRTPLPGGCHCDSLDDRPAPSLLFLLLVLLCVVRSRSTLY